MKTNLRKYFGSLMAVFVLISSMGMGYTEHFCQMRGKSVSWVFSEVKGCSSYHEKQSQNTNDSQQLVFKKKHCCGGDNVYYKNVETNAHADYKQPSFEKISALFWDNYVASNTFGKFISKAVAVVFSYSIQSFSSLYYGRTTLSFVQSFLI